ncbi:LIM/homeobox protein Lhx2 [Oryzias melastigma]|uniref:LIM/homeobox protein Lhx2 n=1 Tax=Oryzias melastigma TaxID=30732 RepID=A0A834FL70_ORYME|nr:LIM/homeobox protein Lhx2 [Oryzias melastigma]
MLFHSLPGGDVHGVVEEMDRRGKGESAAISSAIDMGESETPMPCMTSERVALCAGCGRKIADRYYLLAVDKQWHMRCLKCCECKLNLESELTCFSKDGSIYCKEDYYRRFSVQRCARCHLGISASEMVMRARDLVYHLNCFTCTTCGKMLTTGDHFGMKDSLVYCRLHFETLIQGEYQTNFNHADIVPHKGLGPANTLGLSYFNGLGTVQKGRPRKRKSPGPGAELAAYNAVFTLWVEGKHRLTPLKRVNFRKACLSVKRQCALFCLRPETAPERHLSRRNAVTCSRSGIPLNACRKTRRLAGSSLFELVFC